MNKIELEQTRLIGLSLNGKTTNTNGQSSIDCGSLWQKFEKGNYAAQIKGKLSDEVVAVYHQYEGPEKQSFSYFIGCKVDADSTIPQGLDSLTIPQGLYQMIKAQGIIPDCIINAWKEIGASNIPRTYQLDFEIYDERSKDWNNGEIDIYLSIEK